MGFFLEPYLCCLVRVCLRSPHFYDKIHFDDLFQRFVGQEAHRKVKVLVNWNPGEKLGQGWYVFVYVRHFSLFSMGRFRFLLEDKHKHCGVCDGDDISGYCRRGFGERFFFFFPSSLCARGGCTDTEFKDANREKVETFFKKNFFIRTFPSVCTAPASQHRRSDSHPFRTKL